jgi:hypothetical protein
MKSRLPTIAPAPSGKVLLEKCKICGEWMNRLSLEDVLRHLDHSKQDEPPDIREESEPS